MKADYTAILAKAADSAALLDEVNIVLAAGQLVRATIASIKAAVDSISATATNGPIEPRRDRDPADAGVARISDGEVT